MPKVYLHIGPPKTGTTYLQKIFSSLDNGFYIRSVLSREENQMIRRFFREGEGNQIVTTLSTIKDDILFSDETVLMEYVHGMNWQKQLKRLINLFKKLGFYIYIVITIRNPQEALPSLYQQMLNINWVSKLTFNQFCLTNQAKIYDYTYLVDLIKEIGVDSIKYFDFYSIVNQNEFKLDVFGINNDFLVPKGKANNSLKNENGRYQDVTFSNLIRKYLGSLSFLFPNKLKMKVGKMFRFNISNQRIETSSVPQTFTDSYSKVLREVQ